MRLISCCSGVPDPFAKSTVIKTEIMCPEMTIVASDLARVFRVSAAGKRDFVYSLMSRQTAGQQTTSSTVHLGAVAPGEECAAIVGSDHSLGPVTNAPAS